MTTKLQPAAFFDVDGTLLPSPSIERRFFRYLRRGGRIPAGNYARWLLEAIRIAPSGLTAIACSNKMYVRGLDACAVEEACVEVVGACEFAFVPPALRRVAWHARQGHAIVLVTGTLESLARRVAAALQAHLRQSAYPMQIAVCATRLTLRNGVLTGRIEGELLIGGAKARAVRNYAQSHRIDLRCSYAYGDSERDADMLAATGHPITVNAEAGLRRIARERGWPETRWTLDPPCSPAGATPSSQALRNRMENPA
jgi:HAD superfamily hydrolase (TIGR01490 family)